MLREAEQSQQMTELTQQLASLQSDWERVNADKSHLSATMHESVLKVSRDLPSW